MWPKHAYDLPILIPSPNENDNVGEIYLSGIGWTDDLPIDARKRGITHVVNCAGSFLRERHYQTNIESVGIGYHEIDLSDTPNQVLNGYINVAYDRLEKFLSVPQSKVLIHCFYGQSRSVSILCFYLMKRYDWNYEQAISYVRKYRPIAQPNTGFEQYLRSLKK